MLDKKGIKRVIKKLKKDKGPGEVKYIETDRPEERYSYYLNDRMAWTFGLTRSSHAKSKEFHYVPNQMGLTHVEYRKLHDCPWHKTDLNEKLFRSDPKLRPEDQISSPTKSN